MKRRAVLPVINSVLCVLIMFVSLSLFLTPGVGLYAARAKGTSMLPTIPSDALLILTHKQPHVGDIVHVKRGPYNYAHRVVAIRGDEVVTKGDNCDTEEVAPLEDVEGVVIFHISFEVFLVATTLVIASEAGLAILWGYRSLLSLRREL